MKAGFGISIITPRLGVELAGFGPWLHRTATGIREDLETRAVAVEDNDGRIVVIAACDIISLPQEVISCVRDLVRKKYPDLTDAQLMICATHTHSGPAVRDFRGWGCADSPFVRTLPQRIAPALIQALSSMEEVLFQVTKVPCTGIGINRMHESRTPEPEEVFADGWQPEHPEFTDTETTVAGFFRKKDRSLAGFLCNFGCHPVSCCAENSIIHGDYPGLAMHKVMAKHPGSVGVFLQGAHGDVNTGCVHQASEISTRALECFSDRLAKAVENGLSQLTELSDEARLVWHREELSCTIDPEFTLEFLKDALKKQRNFLTEQKDDTTWDAQLAAVYCDGAEALLKQYGTTGFPKQIPAMLHGIRLNELVLLGAPFEMMQGIRRQVCGVSGNTYPAVLSLCGDALGYAPDRESAEQAKLYESKLVPLINGLLPYGNVWNELPEGLIELNRKLNNESK